MQAHQVLEDQTGPVDVADRTTRPKMWHLMDELREDGNWTLCGIYLDPNETRRSFEVTNDCIVCEDLWDWRERTDLL